MIDREGDSFSGRVRPWVALMLPALAWVLFEYGLAWVMRASCSAVGAWAGPLWGIVCLLTCGAATTIAWPIARRAVQNDPPARPWLARVALVGTAVFGFAIALQTLATLIVPSCAR
jgi:hypothetical protein